jgi:hypothetical protein
MLRRKTVPWRKITKIFGWFSREGMDIAVLRSGLLIETPNDSQKET